MSAKDSDERFDPFDPTGMMKSLRDASMDHWAKVMTGVVNTDTYAEASAEMLDAWLSSSAPFRRVIENAMLQALGNVKIPSTQDITRLAERLTHIEMRLDDMDAKLDELLSQKHEGS